MKSEINNEKIKSVYMRKHPLFIHLNEDHFKIICQRARIIKLTKKNPLLLDAEPVSKIYFLASGTAKLVNFNSVGNNAVSDILVEGDIFGDFSFTGSNNDSYVTGLRSNTYLFYFVADDFKKMLQHNHLLSFYYAEMISTKLRLLESRHSVWTNEDARMRLLYFFQGWTACAGKKESDRIVLDNYFALSDIAEFIGVSRQFMHVMIKELKEEGLLYYTRKKIDVTYNFLSLGTLKQKKAV
ncbi:Crp/Fnr family transcriptional regulator [Ferruginibacter profundus]